jgi:hypothetical protein
VFFVCKTTSELETHDLVDPVICQCRKHRQFAYQEGAFVAFFPMNILMVHLLKAIVISDGHR